MEYTAAEYVEMIIFYGQCNRSADAAARAFTEWDRGRGNRSPSGNVILRLLTRARNNQLVVNRKNNGAGAPRTTRTPENEEAALEAFEEDPTRSIRAVERLCNVSRSSVQRIMKAEKKHAYHYTRVQSLMPQDYPARMNFCRFVLDEQERDAGFVDRILFTDESTFGREGTFNLHNYHIWASENPHAHVERAFQNRFSVNFWAGVLGNRLIGPFELPPRLNGESYCRFLAHDMPLLLGRDPNENEWFQHDGAPPHFALEVRELLDRHYPGRWFGRGGPVAWPPRSPDLNPLDFFVWGHIKEIIYRTPPATIDEIRDRIVIACEMITPEMLLACKRNFMRRVELCLRVDGGHFEHLL